MNIEVLGSGLDFSITILDLALEPQVGLPHRERKWRWSRSLCPVFFNVNLLVQLSHRWAQIRLVDLSGAHFRGEFGLWTPGDFDLLFPSTLTSLPYTASQSFLIYPVTEFFHDLSRVSAFFFFKCISTAYNTLIGAWG